MGEHTPGPWRVGDGHFVVADHPVPEMRGSDDPFYKGHLIAESVAPQNVGLIASAPELLEALIMIRDADEDARKDGLPTIPPIARAKVDAAIAKAKGRG